MNRGDNTVGKLFTEKELYDRLNSMSDRFDKVAKKTPAAAAHRIIQGIERNEPRILIGSDARFMDLLQRFRPVSYWAFLARQIEKRATKAE